MTNTPSDTPRPPPPPEPLPDRQKFKDNTLTDIRRPDEIIDAERMLHDEQPLDNPRDIAATPTNTADNKPNLIATSRIGEPEAYTTQEILARSPDSTQADGTIVTSPDVTRQDSELSPENPRQDQFAEPQPTNDYELTDAERMLSDEQPVHDQKRDPTTEPDRRQATELADVTSSYTDKAETTQGGARSETESSVDEAPRNGASADIHSDSISDDPKTEPINSQESAEKQFSTKTEGATVRTTLAGEEQADEAKPTEQAAGRTPDQARELDDDGTHESDDGIQDTDHGSGVSTDNSPTDGRGARDLPPAEPGTRSVEILPESRVELNESGLIDRVDGQPVSPYLHELGEQRAEQFRVGREAGDFSGKKVGNVISVAIDTRTGEVVEGTNGAIDATIPPSDLHPLLRQRLEDLRAQGPYPGANKDGSINTDSDGNPLERSFPHPDNPLRHAEIKAVNELLWRRGPDAGPQVFGELRVDNFFPFSEELRPAPSCANCSAVLWDTPSNAGRFTGYPPDPQKNFLPE